MLTFERIFTTDSVEEIVDTAKECDSFEINCDDISDEIAISEAVKIAQTYTLKDDVTFVNGVLASVSRA